MYKIAQGAVYSPLSEIFLLARRRRSLTALSAERRGQPARARASRDITVPIGTSVAWAISR